MRGGSATQRKKIKSWKGGVRHSGNEGKGKITWKIKNNLFLDQGGGCGLFGGVFTRVWIQHQEELFHRQGRNSKYIVNTTSLCEPMGMDAVGWGAEVQERRAPSSRVGIRRGFSNLGKMKKGKVRSKKKNQSRRTREEINLTVETWTTGLTGPSNARRSVSRRMLETEEGIPSRKSKNGSPKN